MARLRNRRFFSLGELNRTIAELVAGLNARPMRRLGVSRRELFLELDRPALKELPAEPDEYAEWRPRRLGRDYHVDIDRALLLGAVPADPRAARCAHHRAHDRAVLQGRSASPCPSAAAAATRRSPNTCRARTGRYADWTIERIRADAAAIGPSTAKMTALILESWPHPGQGRALASCAWRAITAPRGWRRPATAARHRRPLLGVRQGELLPDHPNIRGPRYYH